MGSSLPELKEHVSLKLRLFQKLTTLCVCMGLVGGQEINKPLVVVVP